MFIMIDGELLNLRNMTAVTPDPDGPGCVVQFVGGWCRIYPEHGPECFVQAITYGSPIYYVGGRDGTEDHEC